MPDEAAALIRPRESASALIDPNPLSSHRLFSSASRRFLISRTGSMLYISDSDKTKMEGVGSATMP